MIRRGRPIFGIAAGFLMLSLVSFPLAAPAESGFTSENLKWLTNVHVGGFTEGGRLLGRYLYLTDDVRGLVIFDVSNPRAPVVVGELNLPHVIENEDIATNGEIALISQLWLAPFVLEEESISVLNVVDVSDPQHPRVIAQLHGAGDHTYECLLKCAWASADPLPTSSTFAIRHGRVSWAIGRRQPTSPTTF